MKIAWFHSHLLNADSGGTRFVFDMIEALRRNHEVTLFCDTASSESKRRAAHIDVPVVTLDRASTNSATYWLTLPIRVLRKRKKLARTLEGFDVAVASMFPMHWVIEDSELPKVQVCYEPFAFFYDKAFLSSLKPHERLFFALAARAYAKFDKRAIRKMDRVVTVNVTNVAKIQTTYGVEASVVYAAVDTTLFSPAPREAVRALRERHMGDPLLFHSSDLSGTKGTLPLLEIFRKVLADFPRARLLVTVYVDNPGGAAQLERAIARLELESAVDLLGCLPRAQLPLYYSAVDFVCQPSINQPASWPLRESLMCGTPIIGGNESEEVDEPNNGCRVDVIDVERSASKIAAVFRRRDTLQPSVSGDAIRERFSREKATAAFEAILREASCRGNR